MGISSSTACIKKLFVHDIKIKLEFKSQVFFSSHVQGEKPEDQI